MNITKNMYTPRAIFGFSLVELLVAMTLGLILMSGMIAVFSGNKRSSDVNTAMANIQESARFALDSIARDARQSGFQGCIDINRGKVTPQAKVAPIINNSMRDTAATASIVTPTNTFDPVSPVGFVPHSSFPIVAGTHFLMLQFGSQANSGLSKQMSTSGIRSLSAPLELNSDIGLKADDLAIVSNCETGDMFRVTKVENDGKNIFHEASGNLSGNLKFAYGSPNTIQQTSVMKLMSNIYYIGDTGLENESGDTITALYQQSFPFNTTSNPPTELIQGVENMRVAFGIRDQFGSLRYVTPGQTGFDPSRVESIQIGLLMNSWDRVAQDDDANTYILAGQPIYSKTKNATAGDGQSFHTGDMRFRLAFNTTIKVRNRRNR